MNQKIFLLIELFEVYQSAKVYSYIPIWILAMLFKLFRLKFEIGCISLKMGCAFNGYKT